MVRICKEENCNKQSIYNLLNGSPIYCSKHKKKNMVNVKIKKCKEENCNKIPSYKNPNEKSPIYCSEHKTDGMITYIGNTYTYRRDLLELKIQLGGKCIDCKCNELFKLEFDHIDPKLKTKQITKMSKKEWYKEINNIQLLCGNCHRIKSYKEQLQIESSTISRNKKFTNNHKDIVIQIKKDIGGCQICKWTTEDKKECSYALDFDHISGDKLNQISNLYSHTRDTLLNEILKCRLLCRCCHQLYTCIQKGGKMLTLYYDKKTIKEFEDLLKNKNLNIEFQNQIKKIVEKYFITLIDITDFDDLKNFENYYKINKNGDIYSIRNKSLMKQTTKKDGIIIVVLQSKTYYIHELLKLQYNV